LDDSAACLEHSKEVFRERVKAMLEAFLHEVMSMQEQFSRTAPTSQENNSSTTALAFVKKWQTTLEAARAKVRCCGLTAICSLFGGLQLCSYAIPGACATDAPVKMVAWVISAPV
jgi:hypothetical protein